MQDQTCALYRVKSCPGVKYRFTLFKIPSFLAAIWVLDSMEAPKLRVDVNSMPRSSSRSVTGTDVPRKVGVWSNLLLLAVKRHACVLVALNETR